MPLLTRTGKHRHVPQRNWLHLGTSNVSTLATRNLLRRTTHQQQMTTPHCDPPSSSLCARRPSKFDLLRPNKGRHSTKRSGFGQTATSLPSSAASSSLPHSLLPSGILLTFASRTYLRTSSPTRLTLHFFLDSFFAALCPLMHTKRLSMMMKRCHTPPFIYFIPSVSASHAFNSNRALFSTSDFHRALSSSLHVYRDTFALHQR